MSAAVSVRGSFLATLTSTMSPDDPGLTPSPGEVEDLWGDSETSDDSSTLEEEEETERDEGALEEKEDDLVLTDDIVYKGLSYLGRTATGIEQAYLHLCLCAHKLRDIDVLNEYVHLQKLDISYNKIKDLSCVSSMPYLIELDASHNEITEVFGFTPPKNLKVANYSYNQISEMQDLSSYEHLKVLILDYNEITEIRGLENCSSLNHFSLANNKITEISGLDHLPIKTLCLRANLITKISNLEKVPILQNVDLSFNNIQSMSGLENHDLLECINLESNQVSEISEAAYLQDLPLLRKLNLQNNPIQENPEYLLYVLFVLQSLTHLDERKLSVEEKVAAVNKTPPPPEVIAARDHMTHVVYNVMQPQIIYDSTLPSLDAPYPMLILTGPQACGKRELAHKLCREFSDFFAYGACHTTRGPYFGEVDGSDYHFVSVETFEDMVYTGKFIQTMKYNGHYYGLTRDAIEAVAREGLACCLHMELEGVRSLKNTYFEPRYILLIPMDKEEYARRLRMRGLYSRSQIEIAVSRVETYITMNRDFPGYFDTVIPCDDLVEAYIKLSQLVRDYLGLGNQETLYAANTAPRILNETADNAIYFATEDKQGKSPNGMNVTKVPESKVPIEPGDLTNRNYTVKIQTKLSAKKSPVEEASLQRRQQAAKEALRGKSPSAYTDLFKRYPVTAPATLGHRKNLLDPSSYASAPSGAVSPSYLESSSSEGSRASSVMSSAGAMSTERSAIGKTAAEIADREEDHGVEPLDIAGLEDIKDQLQSSTPGTPRPSSQEDLQEKKSAHRKSASSGAAKHSKRVGSNTKPVLPPIPSGRKVQNI
ncbi:LOW QUALITY PROTEIN: leucine-rich repeat and guanylate kinase domain-containing protein [Erpetoichthys calabaricus]|uniref:LOW QUALITY PROTEIN: leucine-rich repeat and guanylate kinase domain-containing protein n=1 Tax=Erpetoichthys calabaricus TaxID=27687 RepID=UPI00223468D7|nr:LOW QUALITY PROTEIN: leucine-rich repeat and guanylate kinase domain-containing protein [Erpetoichthys calabaricus]